MDAYTKSLLILGQIRESEDIQGQGWERLEIENHPGKVLDLLESLRDLDDSITHMKAVYCRTMADEG